MSRDKSSDPTELFVGMVKAGHDTRDERWSQNLHMEGRTIAFKLDTGSGLNIISELEYRTTMPKPRLEFETVMKSYSCGPIPSLGVCSVSVQYKKLHICQLPLVNIKHDLVHRGNSSNDAKTKQIDTNNSANNKQSSSDT